MNKHKQLVDLLMKKTESGALDWKKSVENDEFTLSFSSRTLIISENSGKNVRDQSDFCVTIAITDDDGRIVDSFNDNSLDVSEFSHPWFDKMRGLFLSARRTALEADEAINEILAELAD